MIEKNFKYIQAIIDRLKKPLKISKEPSISKKEKELITGEIL